MNKRIPAVSTLTEIQVGLENMFNEIRENNLYLEYRVEAQSEIPERRWNFLWQNITFAMHHKKNLFYGRHEAPHIQPDGSIQTIVQESTTDGRFIRDRTDKSGFVTDRHGGSYWLDRYLQNLAYVLRPSDLEIAQNRKNIVYWVPYCFSKKTYHVFGKQEQVDGDWCHVIEADGWDKMWIDTKHGYVIRKRQLSQPSPTGKPLPYSEITNSELEKVGDNLWLPKKTTIQQFGRAENPKYWHRHVGTETLQVKKIVFGRELPPGQFHLEFSVGTYVWDYIEGTHYRVTPEGIDLIDDSISRVSKMAEAGSPTRYRIVWILNGVLTIFLVSWFLFKRKTQSPEQPGN